MAVYITEYANAAYVSGKNPGFVPQDSGLFGPSSAPVITTTVLSSAVTSTMTLQATTRWIRIAATANAWILCSASATSTYVATSTNSPPSFANTIEMRGVVPGSRLTCLST